MYFTVNFKDGTVTHIPVSNSHTVQVISPQDQVQDAFSFDGVQSVSLDLDGAPQATAPNPQPAAGAAEGATVDQNVDPAAAEGTPPDPQQADTPAPATQADHAPVEAVTPDPQQAAPEGTGSETASDASSTASAEPQTSSPTPSDAEQHDQAVAAATNAVVAAQATPAEDRATVVEKAQQDVEEALAQWPDSAPLLDLKAQLEQLAAGQ